MHNLNLSEYLRASNGGLLYVAYGMSTQHRRVVAARMLQTVADSVATRLAPDPSDAAAIEVASYPILCELRSCKRSAFGLVRTMCETGHPPEYAGSVRLYLYPKREQSGLSPAVAEQLRGIYTYQREDNAYTGRGFDPATRVGAEHFRNMAVYKELRETYKVAGYGEREKYVARAAHARESSPSNRLDKLEATVNTLTQQVEQANESSAALRGLVKSIALHLGLSKPEPPSEV